MQVNALAERIFIVILLNGNIAATDCDHAVLTSHLEQLDFSAQEIVILFLVYTNYRHKSLQELTKCLKIHISALFQGEVFLCRLLRFLSLLLALYAWDSSQCEAPLESLTILLDLLLELLDKHSSYDTCQIRSTDGPLT